MENEHPYKDHRITLLAREMDNGKWSCAYTAINFGKSRSQGFSGHEVGDTEDDSKRKGLRKAQERIDSIN